MYILASASGHSAGFSGTSTRERMSSVSEENLMQRHHFKLLVSCRLGKTHIFPAVMIDKLQAYLVPKIVE